MTKTLITSISQSGVTAFSTQPILLTPSSVYLNFSLALSRELPHSSRNFVYSQERRKKKKKFLILFMRKRIKEKMKKSVFPNESGMFEKGKKEERKIRKSFLCFHSSTFLLAINARVKLVHKV